MGQGSREPRGHRFREAKPAGHRRHTHHTSQLGGWERGGEGQWPSGSPSPVGPRVAPQVHTAPTHPAISVTPRGPRYSDCHSKDPMNEVRAFLLGSAQDRGARRP